MDTLQQQVQNAIKLAKYNLRDGQLNPDDEKNLKKMQADIDQKIEDLQGIRNQVATFRMSLAGHYS